MITRTLTAALAAAGMSLAGAPALAQAPQGAAQAQPQIAPIKNGELTDAQVEAFIDAATNIRAVIAEYQPKVDAAADREAAIKLQKQARGELVIAVEESGLSPREYQAIAMAAETDPAVSERLKEEAQSRAG